jgi:hypothetical protein
MSASPLLAVARAGLALLLAVALAAPAVARQAPAHIGSEIADARLAGKGAYTYFGLDVYSAQLWVGGAGLRGELPGTQAFALELDYALGLSGQRIADASVDQMEKIGVGSPAERDAWQRQMAAIFPDVRRGTRLCGVYLPGQGARFYLDGKLHATVQDAAFARAFFAIWLHPNTTAKSLRSALLRDARAP